MKSWSVSKDQATGYRDLEFAVVDGLQSVVQRVETRLRFFLGTWFMNTQAGVPYIPDVLGRMADVSLAKRVIADAARGVDGVLEVTKSSFRLGPVNQADADSDPNLARVGFAMLTIRTDFGEADISLAYLPPLRPGHVAGTHDSLPDFDLLWGPGVGIIWGDETIIDWPGI